MAMTMALGACVRSDSPGFLYIHGCFSAPHVIKSPVFNCHIPNFGSQSHLRVRCKEAMLVNPASECVIRLM